MTYKMYAAFIACLGAAALLLAPHETFAKPGPGHSISHRPIAHFFRHHRRNNFDNFGNFWPGFGDYSNGPYGEPAIGGTQPVSGEIRNTCTYDIPWDWVHRCPPAIAPSERPYAPSCPEETLTFPGGYYGTEKTVNIIRCY
jgi:hypothetical protein